jgi:hypothetical protein
MNHLDELTPTKGTYFGLVTFGNGINTSLKECFKTCEEIGEKVGGTLLMALYNRTRGVYIDVKRTYKERDGVETPNVCLARQFMATTAENLHQINPKSFLLCIPHSENGVITKRAIESMNEGERQILQKIAHIFAEGSAEPLPKSMGASVINVYSSKDYVTGFGPFGYAKRYMNNPEYDIRTLKCQTGIMDRVLWIADHGFLKPTYRKAWEGHIRTLKQEFQFYEGSKNGQTR